MPRNSQHQSPPAHRSRRSQLEKCFSPVAQKLLQNNVPNTHDHSKFTGPNRSRLIETDAKPCTPPPNGSGKKRVRAFSKTSEFASPDSISHDAKKGKMPLAPRMSPLPPISKSPRKSTLRADPNAAPCDHQTDFSLFQTCRPALFRKHPRFPAPNVFPRMTQKTETSPAHFSRPQRSLNPCGHLSWIVPILTHSRRLPIGRLPPRLLTPDA
jgi:hypothetical protein